MENTELNYLLDETEESSTEQFTPIDTGIELEAEIHDSLSRNSEAPEGQEGPAQEASESETPPEISQPEDETTTFTLSEFIDPETAVEVLTWASALATPFISKKVFNIETDIEKKDLEFTAGEKKTLRKPLEKLFNDTTIGTKNPLLAFLLIFVIMLALKIFAAYQIAKEREEIEGKAAGKISPKDLGKSAKKRGRKKKATIIPIEPGTPSNSNLLNL